jgi:hypothetical protein
MVNPPLDALIKKTGPFDFQDRDDQHDFILLSAGLGQAEISIVPHGQMLVAADYCRSCSERGTQDIRDQVR